MLTQIKAFLLSRQWEFEQLDDNTVLTGFYVATAKRARPRVSGVHHAHAGYIW